MSTKTLTDELRSVLLYHSLEAPQPNATVDRILAETVGPVLIPGAGIPDGAPHEPGTRRRARTQQLVAAAVVALLLVTVAGINSVRNRNATSLATRVEPASRAGEDRANLPATGDAGGGAFGVPQASDSSGGKLAPLPPPEYAGKLNCSTVPGGRLVTGQWDDFTLPDGQQGYLYEFLCVGVSGQRSASELQAFRQVGTTLVYLRTLLDPAAGQHLDFVIGGTGSARIQVSDYSPAAGGIPGAVVAMAFDISDTRWGMSSATVAEPCLRRDLTVTVSAVPDALAPSWRLSLRNRAEVACALEGYPQIRALRDGVTLTTAVHTMNGPAGGVTKSPVPPIIVLSPGATASAIIEQSAASAAGSCERSDRLAVSLPNGVSLGEMPAELSACGLAVHPLIGNARGSD